MLHHNTKAYFYKNKINFNKKRCSGQQTQFKFDEKYTSTKNRMKICILNEITSIENIYS